MNFYDDLIGQQNSSQSFAQQLQNTTYPPSNQIFYSAAVVNASPQEIYGNWSTCLTWPGLQLEKPQEGKMKENKLKDSFCTLSKPPEEILSLVKGSKASDWHKHPQGGGWVYKTATVHPAAYVTDNAAVYDCAVVESSVGVSINARVYGTALLQYGCCVFGKAKIGNGAVIGKGSSICGQAKVYGTVGSNSTIKGRTFVKSGVVIGDGKLITKTPREFRTQKAKGVEALRNNGFNVPKGELFLIEKLKTEKQLSALIGKFVRPCPVTPRHGFVDSRSVASLEEAKSLIKETKAADSKAELLVMPFIKASHSGIWTDGLLSMGKGNDGATAGKNSYMIPVQGKPESKKWESLLKEAGITQAPYLELLWTEAVCGGMYGEETDYKTQFVQLRDGPKLPDAIDFIPDKIKVEHVIRADGDLLAWETKVKKFKPGTVVYHPGGSLASHYSIHCFLSSIPVIISREPKTGEILKPNTDKPKPDIELLRKGFLLGCQMKMGYLQAAYIMLAGCHSTTKWLGRCDLILGLAMGCCYRLLITASLGEYRHKKKRTGGDGGEDRNTVYVKVWDKTLEEESRKQYDEASISFDKDACWSFSYGGVNWYILSRWGMLIYNALIDGDVKASMEFFNKGVNSVHNGGWTFNKFIQPEEMNRTAVNPLYAVLKIAPILYDSTQGPASPVFDTTKYVVQEIDPEEYLKERRKKYEEGKAKSSYSYATKKITKKCCDNPDCCGNPSCKDCHPVKIDKTFYTAYTTCQCSDKQDHEGKTTWVYGGSKNIKYLIPACEKHLGWYMNPTDVTGVKYEKVVLNPNSCPCQTYPGHEGPENHLVQLKDMPDHIFPVCGKHLSCYEGGGFNNPPIFENSPESELQPCKVTCPFCEGNDTEPSIHPKKGTDYCLPCGKWFGEKIEPETETV